ncbi:hypothetical protein CASFOL_033676 [Castilleja foliolosa]|uniref:rRNA N-glycosylase n=1 Tax=Castilleja foliolosa TaxID=1961234 RepID=A0ABD3BXM0_9LAMI
MLKIRIMPADIEDELYSLVLYYDEMHWVALMYSLVDLYLIGFRNIRGAFQFLDKNYGFHKLRFKSDYGDMQKFSNTNMFRLSLGITRLHKVVEDLGQVIPDEDEVDSTTPIISDQMKASSLLASALMFAESSCFNCIFDHMIDNSDNFGYFNILPFHEFYIKDWSKLSKALIAARDRPSKIGIIDDAIARGLYGLGDGRQGFILPNGQRATNIGHVQSVLRIISRQSKGGVLV